MSDFGTLISIFRNDKKDIRSEEVTTIESVVKAIKSGNDYLDSLGEDLSFHMTEAEESTGRKGLNLILSEYWGGEDEEDEMIDYCDSDREQAQTIADLLQDQLGQNYKTEVYAGGW